jgi:cysteine-S-conjugate beta-lyase
MADPKFRDDTLLTHAGNRPRENFGIVNPPVYHASTILFPTVAAMEKAYADRFAQVTYGRYGTPTTFALEEAIAALEASGRAIALPSGMAAVVSALLAFLKSGDHLLMVDSVYSPVRTACDRMLAGFGIQTTYYDPLIGAAVAELMRPNTRVVYTEAPGSLTFEMQDIPAIVDAVHARGAVVIMDNTWATPLFFKPLSHGVDAVVHAATKYIVGHSDVMLGVISVRDEHWRQVKIAAHMLGHGAAPDDCYLALRGLRTLSVRLERHQANALRIAQWLQERPEVERVMYPALPEHPGHALWKRDFAGASGLLSVLLKPRPKAAVDALLDGMRLFGMGASWGGYESLILPVHPEATRTARPWTEAGALLRLHVGLEDPADLIADMEQGFERLGAAA